MKKLFFVLCLAIFLMAGTANAIPVPEPNLVYTGTYADAYLKNFPPNLNEEAVWLDGAASSSTITGHVGSQADSRLVTFSSTTDNLFAGSGLATIKSASDDYINNITITVPGYLFTDLIVSLNLGPNDNNDLTITAISSNGTDSFPNTLVGWTEQNGWVNGQDDILVLSKLGNSMISVTIDSVFGIQEIGGPGGVQQLKQTEISGLTSVPEPSTMLLLGSGLIGLGLLRRKFKK